MRCFDLGCNGCDECTDYEDYDGEPREPPEFGCCLPPGECCMPGLHFPSECHTAETYEQARRTVRAGAPTAEASDSKERGA